MRAHLVSGPPRTESCAAVHPKFMRGGCAGYRGGGFWMNPWEAGNPIVALAGCPPADGPASWAPWPACCVLSLVPGAEPFSFPDREGFELDELDGGFLEDVFSARAEGDVFERSLFPGRVVIAAHLLV